MEKQLKKLTTPLSHLVAVHARWAFFRKEEKETEERLIEQLDKFIEEATRVKILVTQQKEKQFDKTTQ